VTGVQTCALPIFGIHSAYDEGFQIDKVVILDLTEGKERARIEKLLASYKING